ncbi:MAG: DUF6371 domain-containing protein [Paludibacter sp.]
MNYLQPYKGKDTRHTCPSCKAKLSFTQYLDGNTHKPIHDIVGKCNRESKCGYHYTPKQFFIDNPLSPSPMERAGVRSLSPPFRGGREGSYSSNTTNVEKRSTPSQKQSIPFSLSLGRGCPQDGSGRGAGGEVPFSFVEKSASYKSNFVRFLFDYFSDEQIRKAADIYALGATKNKEVIFWQIDITGKVRTGKIMQYNTTTGKRLKHESGAIDWVHNKLKKTGALPEDFNLQQCFFGEHLLKIYPDKQVAIVESEKSAIIASCIMPELIWLAAGNINGLSIEKCKVLKNRNVMLYPDLGAYEKWSIKAEELQEQCHCKVLISNLLEGEASEFDRANGFDIADYMIEELKFPLSSNSQKVEFLSPVTKKVPSLSPETQKVPTLSPLGESTHRGIELGESSRRGKEVREVRSEVFPEIQSFFSPTLQTMIDKNKALSILISELHLEEI